MNKSYLALITLLIIVALAVGAFAFYKSISTSQPAEKQAPPQTETSKKPVSNEKPLTPEEEILSKNTLPLSVDSPKTNSTVNTPVIVVSGTTDPLADVAVNDKDLVADSKGNFRVNINLDEGENFILIVASNENGVSEWEGTVTYTSK